MTFWSRPRVISLPFVRLQQRAIIRRSMTSRRALLSNAAIPEIQLSDAEHQLCSLLVSFTRTLLPQVVVECCIAGGWVRDKLLGLSSNDIDIALSSMMGFPFALQFSAFLQSQNIPVTRVTKVESRADQSKHLETAKLGVLGLDLDFVNLRSEVYADGSRIPVKVEFGTKLEDTLRRDITINALLYNVHTRTVEDHTQKGLSDLRSGIIRTPLPPKQTFLDDPLRVLRCIRFASRFSYDLVSEVVEAARDEEIQRALETKITRERIGEEIYKMIKGPNPIRAFQLIHALSLYRSIFAPPSSTGFTRTSIDCQSALAAAAILHSFLQPDLSHLSWNIMPHPSLLKQTASSTSTKSRLFLACALTPFKDLTYFEKGKEKPVIEACLREGLKLGVQDHFLDGIPVLFEAAKVASASNKFDHPSGERVALGLFLRHKLIHAPIFDAHWSSTLLFSLVQELAPFWRHIGDKDLDPSNVGCIENTSEASEIIQKYNALVERAEELNLLCTVDQPPLLNGRDITTLLNRKPGPWVGNVLSKIIEWQLANPNGTREKCESWIKSNITEDDLPENRVAKKPKIQYSP